MIATTMTNTTRSTGGGSISPVPSLVALLAGVMVGTVAHHIGSETLFAVRDAIEPLGQLWLRCLRMIVFPLVISTLLVAILNSSRFVSAGRIGSVAMVTFVLFLCVGGLFSYLLGSQLIGLLPESSSAAVASLPDAALNLASKQQSMTFGDWLNSLVPTNPFSALAEGHLLPVIIFTVTLGLALNQVEGSGKDVVYQFFEAIHLAMMKLVSWILVAAPVAIFILALTFSSNMGLEFTELLVNYLLMECGLMILAIILLIPITSALSGVSMRQFANGVLPAQLVAISTRSSLASLPALLEGARDRLKLKSSVADLVLPLSVSVFKTNRPITSMFGFLLLAHLFGIDLSNAQIVTFFITTLVLSFSSVGIPHGGNAMMSLPAYLAVGIPIEGYLLLKTVDTIPDIFKTVINVTGDMSVTTILNRHF